MTTYVGATYPANQVTKTFNTYLPMVNDYPVRSLWATKAISGYVYDDTGTLVSGATVKLVRDIDDIEVATTTSNVMGYYSFVRDASDSLNYHVYAYTLISGTLQIHGTSDRGNVPT